ncbi:hypothetical protein BH09PSE6_BH09PSE6_14830 [soil metagenome]
MTHWLGNQAFIAFAITTVALCLNLLGLWMFSGVRRASVGRSPNQEDVARFGGEVVEHEAPEIARVLRAHANAAANIPPFLFLGLVYVMAGGTPVIAKVLFGVFTIARWLHSIAYLRGWQPWRTVFFLTGLVATLALLGFVTARLVFVP